jgi:hypothetical protein
VTTKPVKEPEAAAKKKKRPKARRIDHHVVSDPPETTPEEAEFDRFLEEMDFEDEKPDESSRNKK